MGGEEGPAGVRGHDGGRKARAEDLEEGGRAQEATGGDRRPLRGESAMICGAFLFFS